MCSRVNMEYWRKNFMFIKKKTYNVNVFFNLDSARYSVSSTDEVGREGDTTTECVWKRWSLSASKNTFTKVSLLTFSDILIDETSKIFWIYSSRLKLWAFLSAYERYFSFFSYFSLLFGLQFWVNSKDHDGLNTACKKFNFLEKGSSWTKLLFHEV